MFVSLLKMLPFFRTLLERIKEEKGLIPPPEDLAEVRM